MSSKDKALEAVNAFKAIYAVADAEGRDLTSSEAKAVERHLAIAQRYQNYNAQKERLGDLFGDAPSVAGYQHGGVGPGDVFVKSNGYKTVRYADGRPQQWTSGPVEVPLEMKGTLLRARAVALAADGYLPSTSREPLASSLSRSVWLTFSDNPTLRPLR